MNYKGIPFKTEWVEFPDIEPVLKKIGGAPTEKKKDGSDRYTLPAIHDDKTGKVIVDSEAIALYLDNTYPDTPKLFPSGLHAAITMQRTFFSTNFPVWGIVLPAVGNILNARSEEYSRRRREEVFGKKLEELASPGPLRDAEWTKVKEGLERVAEVYDKNGEGKVFFFGDVFTFADACTVGYVLCLQIALGAESEEWKSVANWSGGRWGKLLEETKKWYAV